MNSVMAMGGAGVGGTAVAVGGIGVGGAAVAVGGTTVGGTAVSVGTAAVDVGCSIVAVAGETGAEVGGGDSVVTAVGGTTMPLHPGSARARAMISNSQR